MGKFLVIVYVVLVLISLTLAYTIGEGKIDAPMAIIILGFVGLIGYGVSRPD